MFENHLHNALKMIFGNINVKFIPTPKYLEPIDTVIILTKNNNEVGMLTGSSTILGGVLLDLDESGFYS